MDKAEFTAMVAAECAKDPRKLVWLEGFCAGLAAAPAQQEGAADEENT